MIPTRLQYRLAINSDLSIEFGHDGLLWNVYLYDAGVDFDEPIFWARSALLEEAFAQIDREYHHSID